MDARDAGRTGGAPKHRKKLNPKSLSGWAKKMWGDKTPEERAALVEKQHAWQKKKKMPRS